MKFLPMILIAASVAAAVDWGPRQVKPPRGKSERDRPSYRSTLGRRAPGKTKSEFFKPALEDRKPCKLMCEWYKRDKAMCNTEPDCDRCMRLVGSWPGKWICDPKVP